MGVGTASSSVSVFCVAVRAGSRWGCRAARQGVREPRGTEAGAYVWSREKVRECSTRGSGPLKASLFLPSFPPPNC